jgi:hypothetical protein
MVERLELCDEVKILYCYILEGKDDLKEVGYISDENSIWFEVSTLLNNDTLLFRASPNLGNFRVFKSTLLFRLETFKFSPSFEEMSSFSYLLFGLETRLAFNRSPAFSTFLVKIFLGEFASLILAELQLSMLSLKFLNICSETVIDASIV